MLALGRHIAHDLTQVAEFVVAESTLPALDSELANTRGWIFADDVEAGSVTQQTPQRADGAAGNTWTAGRFATAAFLTAAGRFPGGDIRLHPLDVLQGESADEPRAQKRFDVGSRSGFGPSPVSTL